MVSNVLNDITGDTVLNSTMIDANVRDDENTNKNNNIKTPVLKHESSKVCNFYINKKCRHGRSGLECKFLHPKLCYSYLNKGEEGCKNENCEYFHPVFCKFQENCKNKHCKFYHKKAPKKNMSSDDKTIHNKTNKSVKSSKAPQNFHQAKVSQDTSQQTQNQILEALKELTKVILEDRAPKPQKRNCCSQC